MNPSVKVAQPGWNTNTAPDWALVFNSDWPSLQIAFETTLTYASFNGFSSQEVKHNLGFPPLTMGWLTLNGLNYGRSMPTEITPQNLFIEAPPVGATITLRCFNIDISQNNSYPLPTSAAAKTAPDTTTFIKIAKQKPTTRNINSKNLNDFILNSQAQSPAILDIATEKGPYFTTDYALPHDPLNRIVDAIVYPLKTSYLPYFFGYFGLGGGFYAYFGISDIDYNATTNSLAIPLLDGIGSLVILRDPLFYPNTVRIVY